jgi:nucleotide-binding universal stress UspA family protein
MSSKPRPVVVAFDGSDEAREAVRAAATLLGARLLLVVSVWEPGLAMAMAGLRDPTGVGYMAPTFDEMAAVDRVQRDRATDAAEAGARLARELGAAAEPLPVSDEADIAETIAGIAEREDACAIVVGSRGLGGVKSRLVGSTSRKLLHRSDVPVLVVRAPERDE